MKKKFNVERQYINHRKEILEIPNYILGLNNDDILCSVVIPCYNYGRYVRESVESALNQTLGSKEVIIVDDGSDDPYTLDELSKIAKEYEVQIFFKGNGGLVSARNTGIGAANGKYICCLDADDILLPTYLEHCVYELESNSGLGFVYSWVELFGDESEIWKTRDFNIDEAIKENWTSVSAVFRKTDWLLAGRYDRRMKHGFEDWEFWLRLWQLGRKGEVIPQALLLHRRHGITMTHTATNKKKSIIKNIEKYNSALYQNKLLRDFITRKLRETDNSNKFPKKLCSTVVKSLKPMDKLSVLVILPWLKPGGAEYLILDILNGLKKEFQFTIVTTIDDEHLLESHFRKFTDEIYHFPEKKKSRAFINFVSYMIKTRDIKLVLTSGSRRLYENVKKVKDKFQYLPVVDILHNDSDLGHSAVSIANSDYIDRHICVSDTIKRSIIRKGVPGKKVVAIPNGIDVEGVFRPRSRSINDMRIELEIPTSRPVIGFVGRASEEKRPMMFLELLKKLKKDSNAFGVCVCSGYLVNDMRKYIEDHNLARDTCIIDELPRGSVWKIYNACDILVNVSSVEGMPLTVLEALATGCPVAAMKIGNLEAVISNGENGILVGKDEFNELYRRISEVFRNETVLMAMRKKAREKIVSSVFNIKDMVSSYRNIVTEMVKAKN